MLAKSCRWLVVFALGLSFLAGCEYARIQMAYSIGDDEVSIEEVVTLTNACLAVSDGSLDDVPEPSWINDMIHAELARRVAASHSGILTDEELRRPIDEGEFGPLLQAMAVDQTCAEVIIGLTLMSVLIQEIGEERFIAEANQHEVLLNPRFGVWDPETLTLSGSGSMSKAGSPLSQAGR